MGFVLLLLLIATISGGMTIFGAQIGGEVDRLSLSGREKSKINQADNSLGSQAQYEKMYAEVKAADLRVGDTIQIMEGIPDIKAGELFTIDRVNSTVAQAGARSFSDACRLKHCKLVRRTDYHVLDKVETRRGRLAEVQRVLFNGFLHVRYIDGRYNEVKVESVTPIIEQETDMQEYPTTKTVSGVTVTYAECTPPIERVQVGKRLQAYCNHEGFVMDMNGSTMRTFAKQQAIDFLEAALDMVRPS